MAAPPPLRADEVLRVLRVLVPVTADPSVVLVGGQARAAADLLGGRSRIPSFDHHTPLTGVVFFDDSDGIERRIDFLASPLGLDGRDVRDTAVDVEIGADAPRTTLWAMHPDASCKAGSRTSRFSASTTPTGWPSCGRRSRSPEWSRFLLADCSISERDRVRGVLRLNERIFRKCVRDLHFRQLFADRRIDPFDASWRTMSSSRRRSASVATRR